MSARDGDGRYKDAAKFKTTVIVSEAKAVAPVEAPRLVLVGAICPVPAQVIVVQPFDWAQ